MKKLSPEKSKLCKLLRKSGYSHRYIAKKLKVSLGTVFNYSQKIHLTKSQHLFLKFQAYNKSLGLLSKTERRNASRKGGLNVPKHLRIKFTREQLITLLKDFYKINGRIPYKEEFSHYRAIRNRFGTWNNAIKEAGFDPNPVKFAKKYIASDGHKCDSLAEKIIDDWMYLRKIPHEIKVPYGKNRMTADFKVNGTLIEFFGLNGELKSYDRIVKKKEKLWKERNLRVIKIYPNDLFPVSRLDSLLGSLQYFPRLRLQDPNGND